MKKSVKTPINIMAIASVLFLFMFGKCGCFNVNDVEGRIETVVDGRTVVLNSGLTVHLYGIRSNNTFCKEQLKHCIGKEVSLLSDTHDPNTKFCSFDEEVEAYVYLTESGKELNYELLKLAGEDAFDSSNCEDRREDYLQIFCYGCNPPLTDPELCSKMTAASMLVYAGDPYDDGVWIGTAFFIGEDGLALTNNHVLNHQTKGYVYLSDSYGNVDTSQPFKIERIVYTNEDFDYTIFYVDLDPTSLRSIMHLDLAKKESFFQRGEKVGVIGNPAPGSNILTMSFALGEIAAFRTEQGKIQISAPITHGFSGGPTANNRGLVVGISQSGYEEQGNLNFAVDIRIVRDKLNELNLPYGGK